MAAITPPKSEELKVDKVGPALESAIDKIDNLQTCYEKAATTADKFESDRSLGNKNVPWDITNANKRNAFEYIYSEPLQSIMAGSSANTGLFINPDSSATNLIGPSINISGDKIEGFGKGVRYDRIFKDHQQFIKGPGSSLSNLLTEARTNLETLNVDNYQSNLNNAKRLLVNQMIEPVRIFIQSIEKTDQQITNPQSLFYKSASSYGTAATFDPQTIGEFDMGSEMASLRLQAAAIFTKLRNLFNSIDELSKIKEDVLKRVVLSNQGFKEDPTQPGSFIKGTEAKDGWAIKFSYRKSLNPRQVISSSGQNEALNNSLTQTRSRDSNRQQALNNSIQQDNVDFINDTQIGVDKYYYMQLLPAIKSNLPVQGGVDVPGAMPGLQFRIENNIVKHKIPGFAPIYQPLGIDSIKCTLVGLFTGSDGVSIDSTLREDLIVSTRAKSLASQTPGEVPKVIPFDIVAQAKEGFQDRPFARTGGLETGTNRQGLWDHVPNLNNTTGAVSMTYDAFMNAQEFYNEIVSSGVEIEVEINTRARSGGSPGGSAGPFRDKETGNPKFKALIKRMDMYYVRQDRVYYILDLLITNSGLIGTECINLTNIIEESVELFDEAIEEESISLDEIKKCFGNDPTKEYTLKGEQDGKLVINTKTGLSYKYRPSTNKLLSGQTYPLSVRQTFSELISDLTTNTLSGTKVSKVKLMRDILVNATESVKPLGGLDRNFTVNQVSLSGTGAITTFGDFVVDRLRQFTPFTAIGTFFHDGNAKFDKNSGRWFAFSGDNVKLTRGKPVTFEFKEGLNNLKFLSVRLGRLENYAAVFSELLSVVNLRESSNPSYCNTESQSVEEEKTQTPIQSSQDTEFNAEVPTLQDIITASNSRTRANAPRPVTAESRGRFQDENTTGNSKYAKAIADGDLNPTIIKGINEYLSLINKESDGSSLGSRPVLERKLVETIKRNKSFSTDTKATVSNITVLSAKSTTGGREIIQLEVSTTVNGNKDFTVRSGTSTRFYPGITSTIFSIDIAVYKETKEVIGGADSYVYRMRSIQIKLPNYSPPVSTTEVVPTASTNTEPGDTNTPSKL